MVYELLHLYPDRYPDDRSLPPAPGPTPSLQETTGEPLSTVLPCQTNPATACLAPSVQTPSLLCHAPHYRALLAKMRGVASSCLGCNPAPIPRTGPTCRWMRSPTQCFACWAPTGSLPFQSPLSTSGPSPTPNPGRGVHTLRQGGIAATHSGKNGGPGPLSQSGTHTPPHSNITPLRVSTNSTQGDSTR